MSSVSKPKAVPEAATEHPKYTESITALDKEMNGSSRQTILKYIQAYYKVVDNAGTHVKLALKRGVISGSLTKAKGTGASGFFKKPAAKKPAVKKPAEKNCLPNISI